MTISRRKADTLPTKRYVARKPVCAINCIGGENDMTDIGRRVVEFVRTQINESVSLLAVDPTGGACQENYRVDLSIDDAPASFVLRSDSETSLPGSLGRRDEFAVIKAAHEAGVCTPCARWLGFELARNGAWAYALDWLDGETMVPAF